VHPRTACADFDPECLDDLVAVAVMVAVGEQDQRGGTVLGQPPEPLRREHRVDQDPFGAQVVRAHLRVDALMESRPMNHSRDRFVHRHPHYPAADTFHSSITRVSRSWPSTPSPPARRANRAPAAASNSSQRAVNTRRMWPWANSSTSP